MKRVFVGIILAGMVCLCVWLKWRSDEPRRNSLKTLAQFTTELVSGDQRVLDRILMPEAVRSRTAPEQLEFIRKSLQDEISLEGFDELKKHAIYGSLKHLFPTEAEAWTKQAGVNPDDCVAFRLDRNGLRTEVVLARGGQNYRIVRCNNVKQLAAVSR